MQLVPLPDVKYDVSLNLAQMLHMFGMSNGKTRVYCKTKLSPAIVGSVLSVICVISMTATQVA